MKKKTRANNSRRVSQKELFEIVIWATATIVRGYASHHTLSLEELTHLIQHIYQTVSAIEQATRTPRKQKEARRGLRKMEGTQREEMTAHAPSDSHLRVAPAVRIEDSITSEYLVCLEDGKRMKILKRHLRHLYGLTPEDYRARWGLSKDYPMVAPGYAARRRQIALDQNFGQREEVPAESPEGISVGTPKDPQDTEL